MTAVVGNTSGQPLKSGSMGRPLPGVPVVLVDTTGLEVDGIGEGELCLDLRAKPLPLLTGYQGDDERNGAAMEGGYNHTGDVATRDEDGYITYVGRTDDVFKASDYKVSPFELPKTISGKIRRVELRQRENEVEGNRPEGEYRDEDFPELKG